MSEASTRQRPAAGVSAELARVVMVLTVLPPTTSPFWTRMLTLPLDHSASGDEGPGLPHFRTIFWMRPTISRSQLLRPECPPASGWSGQRHLLAEFGWICKLTGYEIPEARND